ncbi:MAG TPA: efflux RND transporter permease subunit [Cyclobacteriaceae bacterium]|nr:efflux RND transporter permease subunit [Cyclobacteriaceae bacterium]
MEPKPKEFGPTSWAIDNRTSIYVLSLFLALFGIISYVSIPKEQFPEIVIPYIFVTTVYPGTSPSDMENLVTKPLEKNLKSINGVRTINSNSIQDFSSIVVEFRTGIDVSEAKQKVEDAVNKTRSELPNDLPIDPSVVEIDLSEIPIMYINISGNYHLEQLKKYGEELQDLIESQPEITRVDIVGALDREIQIDVDMFKMQAASVTLSDIERAVASDNLTIAGGSIGMHGMTRSIRVVGEFTAIDDLKNIIFTSASGAIIRLTDIARITDGFKEQESYARLDLQNVVTLNVIKKSGQNLLDASDKIKASIENLKQTSFPDDLNVVITGDQSRYTRSSLTDLNNTMIIGFILVTVVLMFFMGLTNALFVGLSIPLAMALSYIFLPFIGFTMNMLVMFSFIFALGIIVDDAIVVIENTHRIFKKSGMDITRSAKYAAGEVFVPILSGTLTTLAPFFPLAFWPGTTGKFMFFIPVTLIIALFASLIVAYLLNPVFAVSFMKHDDDEAVSKHQKRPFFLGGIFIGIACLFYIPAFMGFSSFGIPNFIMFLALIYLAHNLFGYKLIRKFQHIFIPGTLNLYEKTLRWMLIGNRPYYLLGGLILALPLMFFLTGLRSPKVVFFPEGEPNMINVYIKMPIGTDVEVTDSIAKIAESRVLGVLGEKNPVVESMVTNIALGASENVFDQATITSNKAKITVNFVEYNRRNGVSTTPFLQNFRDALANIPGTNITVDKEAMGPPTGKPINIEFSGEDIAEIATTMRRFTHYVDSLGIPGIEELKTDFETSKPELVIDIDRERANREGLSAGQVGMEIRTAILGKEISKFREGEDQYPIQLRYSEYERKHIDRLMALKITFRDMNTGMLRQIPLSAVARVKYQNTYGGITRIDVERNITVYSNVLTGFTVTEINAQLMDAINSFPKPSGVEIKLTGEREDQQESSAFLGKAMLISLALILFILITQFNSIGRTVIILSEVLFSVIGVLLGFFIFNMTYSIIMTGMGIVALAGIVVRNGILLVEFTDVLRKRGVEFKEAIVQGGKTRITPILLTATAGILGLVPLAMGLNINFVTLFTELNPQMHIGGDSAAFFGALAWTIVFGLAFATFLTLIFLPVMYYILYHKRAAKEVATIQPGTELDTLV